METKEPEQQQHPEVKILGKEQAFLLYATFCGDVERTAHALNVEPSLVIDTAEKYGWNKKLRGIIALKQSAAPGDVERGINRAINFTMAHRYRLVLERVINKLSDMSKKELEAYVMVDELNTKTGVSKTVLTTKALADLAAALEKCTLMTYQALADTTQDRARRDEAEGGGEASGAIHAGIAKAMAEIAADHSPGALMLDAQLAAGQANAEKVKIVATLPPYDKD
jgi:hypothetical protein